ncbi:MAG: 50S ribosomal protein L3 [Pelagibacteraceae bacterium]|nr:50S ribosomal protein L3 [Pelagibacteraceae bacterium]
MEPKKYIKEERIYEIEDLNEIGSDIKINLQIGDKVIVQSRSIGKGFAGVMKRHNFSGLRASHGVSISHRSHGSTGQNQNPGRVFKGKKMAGHLGNEIVTQKNLEVLRIDEDNSLIFLKGSVPGKKSTIVKVYK